MNIGIVGWYGTDTLGDRAILDGIFEVLKDIDDHCNIFLGSLFCFYSERTILEETNIFNKTAPNFSIKVFDLKDRAIVNSTIKEMDAIIMGGGPLMDIEELFLVERCFDVARKRSIPRIIMGCGVGPLENIDYRNSVSNILNNSTAIYLRDELSIDYINNTFYIDKPIHFVGDPAIISIEKHVSMKKDNDVVAINFRDYPREAYSAKSIVTDSNFVELINICADKFKIVKLVPMHTFFIGGDDREYLVRLKNMTDMKNIEVIQKPMNLESLYNTFAYAYACIGMRYHSVVMQTILNGNNLVLNYTNEYNGKISGFIKSLRTSFYDDRVVNLQSITEWEVAGMVNSLKVGEKFNYKKSSIKEDYTKLLKSELGR